MIMGLDYGREWNLGIFFFFNHFQGLFSFACYHKNEIITLNLIIILII